MLKEPLLIQINLMTTGFKPKTTVEEGVSRFVDWYLEYYKNNENCTDKRGFDPIILHLKYIEEAKKLGDKLVVALNSDEWLIKKKGKFFFLFRKKIF